MPVVTLLTDFGTTDYYVAAVKGTIVRLAGETMLIDVSHQVPAGEVEVASFLLAATVPAFPPGTVHLAVVDPGVGSERRILAAERDGHLFVAPDNGLLTPVLESARVHRVDREDLFLPSPGATFHGRDRFAPIAAALLRGVALHELGPEVRDAVRLEAPPPRRQAGTLRGRVVHVDRFGNLVTDLPAAWLEGRLHEARVGDHTARTLVTHYAALPAGCPGVLVGSLGTLELSLRGDSLAAAWDVAAGETVIVRLRRR